MVLSCSRNSEQSYLFIYLFQYPEQLRNFQLNATSHALVLLLVYLFLVLVFIVCFRDRFMYNDRGLYLKQYL